MKCFIQQAFVRHLLFAGLHARHWQEKYDQERVLARYPCTVLGEQDGATVYLFWLSPEPPYIVPYSCAHGVIRLLPACLTHNLLLHPGLPYQCLPLSFPSLLPFHSFFLCLIKKHLLATHCSSQQNLYFRHVEPWILNLNTNVAGGPNYFICP